MKKCFGIEGDYFVIDGKKMRILSGAMHYFRVVPEYWADRFAKMKAFGLNTVETYMSWNLHEPKPGKFNFAGMCDVESFIKAAQKAGLYVILRPGPYICSEWDFGGLPSWLLKDKDLKLRCLNAPYLKAVDRYFKKILPRLSKLKYSKGGPIIAMQIENEYGSYGNDKEYLRWIESKYKEYGFDDTVFFTSDGPSMEYLSAGTLPNVLKTVNFGGLRAPEIFEILRKFQKSGPLMCTEFWNGWFEHWGDATRTTRAPQTAADGFDALLKEGASVNFYMFHGGTNFGFMSGANSFQDKDGWNSYGPDVTTYDYDAPIDEAGDITEKYRLCRAVLEKYEKLPPLPEFPPLRKKAYQSLTPLKTASLFRNLNRIGEEHYSVTTEPMEKFGQDYGFILYRSRVYGPARNELFKIHGLADRAQVFLDGKNIATIYRNEKEQNTMEISIPEDGANLEILVENMGRINYGAMLRDSKGINLGVMEGNLTHGNFLMHWDIFTLPMDNLEKLKFSKPDASVFPRFDLFELDIKEAPSDTFIGFPGMTKGVCWVNGFNLGRYWNIGPQKRLFIPAPLLKKGKNKIIVLDLHASEKSFIDFSDKMDLGPRKENT